MMMSSGLFKIKIVFMWDVALIKNLGIQKQDIHRPEDSSERKATNLH